MPSKPDYLQLESGDDAAAVRDRLAFLRGRRVLIVWPEAGSALTRKLDLVLVQREAARLAIRMAIVTHDPQVAQHARDLGISAFETIGESERRRWKRGRMNVFASRSRRPGEEPSADELMPVASRVRSDMYRAGRSRPLVQVGTLLLIVAAIVGVTYFILPTATIAITPAQARIQVEVPITADPSPQASAVEVESAIIPATIVQVPLEDSATTETTGQSDTANVRAAGSVVFINQTNDSIDIPAGTVVATSAGSPILFQTSQGALLNGGTGLQVEAPVEALPEFAGSVGNVDAGLINAIVGELSGRVSVRNLAPTSGGVDRAIRSVTAADQERLLFTLRQQLQARACDEMTARVASTQIVLCDTVRIIEERSDLIRFSAQPGEIADSLSLSMRIVVEATAIDQRFGQQVAFARLAALIPRGRIILPETVAYEPGVVQSIDSEGRVGFVIRASGTVVAQVDPDFIRERVTGRAREDALSFLANEFDLQPDTPPHIILSPDWLPHLPMLSFRINVVLNTPSS
jgi:hypothetical protein